MGSALAQAAACGRKKPGAVVRPDACLENGYF